MLARPDKPETLTFISPDAGHARWSFGFVHRQDGRGGQVVYELPELRSSIQIMLGDDYWLRDRIDPDSWAPVPRIALWGPRLNWGYGFARKVIHAFGVGLTPSAVEALTGRTPAHFVDRVVDLAALRPDVARELASIVSKGAFEDWRREASALLSRCVGENSATPKGVDPSTLALVDGTADHVRRAGELAGIGGRHFRRRFRSRYGLSPRQYRRVLRIDRLLRRLHPRPWEADLFEPDPEFADQAHMIREFKALTGVTPGAYVRSKRHHGDATIRSVFADGVRPPAHLA